MSVAKVLVAPLKWVWLLGLIVGVYFAVSSFSAGAQSAPICQDDVPREQCMPPNQDVVDVCWNLDGVQTSVPVGYHIDESQDNACVEDPPAQVLGSSTTSEPQVLAETTGK